MELVRASLPPLRRRSQRLQRESPLALRLHGGRGTCRGRRGGPALENTIWTFIAFLSSFIRALATDALL